MFICLFFCLLFIPFNMVHAASLALNTMPKAYKSVQKTTTKETEADSFNDDYDDTEETSFDGTDDEPEDFDFEPSFHTKMVRIMRSIKKHSAILIAGLSICTLTYCYWYKIWPFSNTNTTVDVAPANAQHSVETQTNKDAATTTHIELNNVTTSPTEPNQTTIKNTASNQDKQEKAEQINKETVAPLPPKTPSTKKPAVATPSLEPKFNFKEVIPAGKNDNQNVDSLQNLKNKIASAKIKYAKAASHKDHKEK